MYRVFIIIICFLAASLWAKPSSDVSLHTLGTLQFIHGVNLKLVAYNGNNTCIPDAKNVVNKEQSPKSSSKQFNWHSEWSFFNNTANVQGKVIFKNSKNLTYSNNVTVDKNVKDKNIILRCSILATQLCSYSYEVDGQKIDIPIDLNLFNKKEWQNVKSLALNMPSYNLQLIGNFSFSIEYSGSEFYVDIAPQCTENKLAWDFKIEIKDKDFAKQISSALENLSPQHPRLFPIQKVPMQEYITNTTTKKVAANTIAMADLILPTPVLERKMDDPKRMLALARQAKTFLTYLSMAYNLTGDMRYANRAKEEMLNFANFANWNPQHFLDTAELTLGMAIAYDSCYNMLTTAERDTIANAIRDKGLQPSIKGSTKALWWITSSNNWSQVCHGGLIAGALAIADREPKLATSILARAVKNLHFSLNYSYNPHGAYPEGPGYWAYGTLYATIALDLLSNALGNTFDLDKTPGFLTTHEYLEALTGASGRLYTFGDVGGSGRRSFSYPMFSLAYRTNNPELLEHIELKAFNSALATPPTTISKNSTTPLFLFVIPEKNSESTTPKLSYYSGTSAMVPVASMRTGFDKDAASVIISAGPAARNHGHIDCGSFMFDVNQMRWAEDLGMQSYAPLEALGMNLSKLTPDAPRWNVFKIGHKSHNIPIINDAMPNVYGRGTITNHTDNIITVDLSDVYSNFATKVTRSAELLPNRILQLTDSFEGIKKGSSLRFQFCTKAEAKLDKDGSLTLTQQNHQIKIANNINAVWEITPVEKFLQSYDKVDKGFSMISFNITTTELPTTYTVTMTPIK